jgi:hypothetical protein
MAIACDCMAAYHCPSGGVAVSADVRRLATSAVGIVRRPSVCRRLSTVYRPASYRLPSPVSTYPAGVYRLRPSTVAGRHRKAPGGRYGYLALAGVYGLGVYKLGVYLPSLRCALTAHSHSKINGDASTSASIQPPISLPPFAPPLPTAQTASYTSSGSYEALTALEALYSRTI